MTLTFSLAMASQSGFIACSSRLELLDNPQFIWYYKGSIPLGVA
jgi:hypothetical protein